VSNPISIVVDADIARASGTSEHPVSSGSRALLDNVSKNGHKLAICPTMMSEWKKHKSIFAKKWLASMVAKKKVLFIKPAKQTNDLIIRNLTDSKKITIATKDEHLIDAALETDRVIASNDDIARNVFCDLSTSCGDIRNIKWFNSISDKSFIDTYLSTQCFVPQNYYIVSGQTA
jgi:hypothetical protein|tara:strand:+ start:1358 stop:1882 length:525 start_codon:yes stop_codon:yes gene_type:complete